MALSSSAVRLPAPGMNRSITYFGMVLDSLSDCLAVRHTRGPRIHASPQFGNERAELRVTAHRIERTVGAHRMGHAAKSVVVRAPQGTKRSGSLAEQCVGARTVIERLAVRRIELEHTPENGVRFLLPAITSVPFSQAAEQHDVIHALLELA